MKFHFTLPSNQPFYNRYAGLIPTLNKLSYLAQIISALTEIGVLYALIFSSVADFVPDIATPIAIAGAILGTAFIEIGLRKFAPFGVRAIIFKRWKKEDLAISLIVVATAAGLLFASGFLSFTGSKNIVEAIAPEPDRRNTVAEKADREKTEREAREQYKSDVQATQGRHRAKIEATADLYAGLIAVEQQNIKRFEAREKATGKSYRTAKGRIRKKIAELEADKARKVAVIREQEATDLAALQSARNDALKTAYARYAQAEQEATEYNKQQAIEARQKINKYGGNLAYFTVFALFVFLLSISINELHRKGSGIEEKPLPSQYDFSQGIFATAVNAINNRIQYKARTLISNFEAKTPPPPAPTPPQSLYDLAELEPPRLQMQFERNTKNVVTVPHFHSNYVNVTHTSRNSNANVTHTGNEIEQQAIEYTRAALELFRAGLEKQAREMELKADDVICAYLGPEATPEAVNDLRSQIVTFLNGDGQNPFRAHHRAKVGFKVGTEGKGPETIAEASTEANNNATVITQQQQAGKLGKSNCENCGAEYTQKVSWQKYCCKQCRIDHHAERHGKPFDPSLYKKR